MEIKILGAHNSEFSDTKLVCLLIDDVLAIDAGGLTSSLSLSAQEGVKHILLTHQHYDHIRDIPALALNMYAAGGIEVYASAAVLDALSAHIVNGEIYPKFDRLPFPEKPVLRFCAVEPYKPVDIGGYTVLAVPVNHGVPTVGYQVAREGKAFFYSGDTGPGCSGCWEHVSPDLLIIEVTLPNEFEQYARAAKHLTPRMLKEELAQFQKIKSYLPPIVIVHMSPQREDRIREEVAEVARELGATISLGYEGMRLTL